MNVIQELVGKGWCIGCGMCAAVCPRNRLEIRWNERGEYNPVEVDGCADCGKKCSLCYQVCPAHGNTKNETEIGREWYGDVKGIQHTDETGYFLSSYVGYSDKNDHRKNGASGGMATWTLETLLETGMIGAVAAVGRTTDPDKLFEFKICKRVEDIRACSRSAYYPVETSQVIRHILHNDGTYAIIGLPCVCKAIRLAQDKFSKLKQRIKYVLGLTCGHQCSKFFAEYICAIGGGDPYELKGIIFRAKDLSQPASNHVINFHAGVGINEVSKQVLWDDGVSNAYGNGYFQLPGCFYCDDVFAECADVTFMDAWLPEYVKDPKGTSLLIIRCRELQVLLEDNSDIERIKTSRVIDSQRAAIKRKRLKLFGSNTPLTRSFQGMQFIVDRMIETQMLKLSVKSGQCWNRDIVKFQQRIRVYKKRIERLYVVRKTILAPIKLIRLIFRKLC